jgi:hypothetical protein
LPCDYVNPVTTATPLPDISGHPTLESLVAPGSVVRIGPAPNPTAFPLIPLDQQRNYGLFLERPTNKLNTLYFGSLVGGWSRDVNGTTDRITLVYYGRSIPDPELDGLTRQVVQDWVVNGAVDTTTSGWTYDAPTGLGFPLYLKTPKPTLTPAQAATLPPVIVVPGGASQVKVPAPRTHTP